MVVIHPVARMLELFHMRDAGVMNDDQLQSAVFQLITPSNVEQIFSLLPNELREGMVFDARFIPRNQTFDKRRIWVFRSAADTAESYSKSVADRHRLYVRGFNTLKDYLESILTEEGIS